jgi:hypothetical protein
MAIIASRRSTVKLELDGERARDAGRQRGKQRAVELYQAQHFFGSLWGPFLCKPQDRE